VDFLRPVEAVIPGARGKLLAVFAETTSGLSVRTASRLSGVSLAQTSRILPDLAALGILERTNVPPSVVYRLVEENVASRSIRLLARSRDLVLAQLGEAARLMAIPPISVVVFGSLAQGNASQDSDVDVLMVHRNEVENMPTWSDSVEQWRRSARQLTGNDIEVMEADEHSIASRLRSRRPVWQDIRRDGIVVFGKTPEELRALVPMSRSVSEQR
jgi:predicted nucleotidyltransferase